MDKELLDYFDGDELAASVWLGKYALKDGKEYKEKTPEDMHRRMAKELARIEKTSDDVFATRSHVDALSEMGYKLYQSEITEDFIMEFFDKFRYIVPQGSIMSALGNFYKLQSLSNCFVIPSPLDSYGGIFKTDQEIAQLEKRRGGVGTNLNTLRPDDTPVLNAAGTSTGAHSFMDRYSNTTREVAQNGRRGALMLLMSCLHPDIFKFVSKKKDRTKVTGANVSVMFTDMFMEAVLNDMDFYCRFPVDCQLTFTDSSWHDAPYNTLLQDTKGHYFMRIKAKELYDQVVENAWDNAEPGVAFMDRVHEYSPDGVYAMFKAIASNPCGEQWLPAYDACRLFAVNFFSVVRRAFQADADIDFEKLYEICYMQQRLADNLVDLEIEYIGKIIDKIKSDPEPDEIKAVELNLWLKVREIAQASRRTGCGFTALADMLAALGLKYDSEEALKVTEEVMRVKMRAELDCTIDLAILRGPFKGWNTLLETNSFYDMLAKEFPDQHLRMTKYGRRNVSWSTVAPTGSVSILTQTTSGLEPLFLPYYMRRKKVNAAEPGVRVDFVDQNGDSWTEYPILHPKFKEWIQTVVYYSEENMPFKEWIEIQPKDFIEACFKRSPWYGACANDIAWEKRIEIQAVIQKYTTNAISSTMNLPENVSKETVAGIYMEAWKRGLKGVTIYRDNCRTGVLVAEKKVETNDFGYSDAVKRPKEIPAQLHLVTIKGQKYGVAVGLLNDNPYEIFAFPADETMKSVKGKIRKIKKGQYDFIDGEVTIENLQTAALHADEQVMTRLVSGMLRHGVNPYFIIEQINKTPLEVVSFGKAITRVLKQYIKEEELRGKMKCNDCGSTNVRLQEGCVTCLDCGSSKCG